MQINSNANLEITANGTGFVVIDQVHIEGNEVSANESNANYLTQALMFRTKVATSLRIRQTSAVALELLLKLRGFVTQSEGVGCAILS